MINAVKKFAASARGRLLERSILAGVIVGYLQAKGQHVDRGAIEAAVVAGGWAFAEYFTPLNGLVGNLKTFGIEPPATTTPPAAKQ